MVQKKFEMNAQDIQLLEAMLDEVQAAMDIFHSLGESEVLFLKHLEIQEGIRVHLTQVVTLFEKLSEAVREEYNFVPWDMIQSFITLNSAETLLAVIHEELPQLHGDLNYLLWDARNGK
jgi:uncharacterized protein with HEPN domain